MFTPRLPSHQLLRAIAIRQLNDRQAMLAAVMADQNRINSRINRLTPVRENSRRPVYIPPSCDIRLTRLHLWSQEERDPSLLNGTVYSSRICTNIGAPLPITFGTRAAFARTFR